MAKLLYRLGLASARHRIAVVLVWFVLLVTSGVGAATLSGPTSDSFEIPGQDSVTAFEKMSDLFGGSTGAPAQIVLQSRDGQPITGRENAAGVEAVVARLQQIPEMGPVSNPLDAQKPAISQDQSTVYIDATFKVQSVDITHEQLDGLEDALDRARGVGLTAEMTGEATQTMHQSIAEVIGVVVALIVLTLTFGSLVTAGMNMLTALIGVGVGIAGITAMTGFVELSSTTPILASMLGLAVGIDYALFIFTRFRSQLLDGNDVKEAAAMAVGTAGSAVLTAGLTVVIALAGLTVVGIPFLGQMGLGAAVTVVIAVLIALTLVPAVLALLGRRTLRRSQRAIETTITPQHTPRFITAWAHLVTRHHWKVLLTTVVALAVIAIPVASLQTSLGVRAADDSTQQRAAQILDEKFGPGISGPLVVLVEGAGSGAHAAEIVKEASATKGVVMAMPSAVLPDDSAALVTIIPESGPDSEETVQIVKDLRERFAGDSGPRTYVTGQTAVSVDVSQKLNEALPLYLAIVVGLAFVLLILVFRSILVPLTAVVGFLLTIGASFGAMVAVFQWGWLSDVFHPGTPGPVLSFGPVLIIGILFGLAMDYQVFLVSRMHEAYAHGADATTSIVRGFKQSAPVVLTAATIMFGVFAGFIAGDPMIKSIAFTLAIGIVFDAVVVRMLAIPAVLTMLGDRAWWFPKWLGWLPELDVEGQALERRNEPTPQS